ncbi:MAG TPA: hypothetical protein VGG19_13960 [Tepidisphaeraceae bacterium]|jgi:hypothetical protein
MKNATEFIKKHLLSLICGAVALLAVIALFYPLGGKQEKLVQDLQTRASVLQTIQGISNKQRTLPVIDPSNPTPKPLDRFPNQQLIDQAKAIPDAFANQAKAIAAEAEKINKHEPLVQGALPYPQSSIDAFNFREAYKRIMNPTSGELLAKMRAGHPPTPDEITQLENDLYQKSYVPQLIFPPNAPAGTPALNAEQIQTAFEADKLTFPLRATQHVATTCMIYVDPTALSVSPAPTLAITNTSGSSNAPSPEEMWYAQLGVWIQDDVANAIIRTNGSFKSVIEAPAKRLIKVLVDQRPYIVPASYQPGPPTDTNDQTQVPKDISVSPTGRECNSMYDVVHFDIVINVEATKIPMFLDELNDGQFITILKCDVKTVDAGMDKTLGYIYGTQSVAQLHLVCEEVFLRDWCRKLMPKEVAANLMGTSIVSGGGGLGDTGGDMGGAPPPMGGPGGMPTPGGRF